MRVLEKILEEIEEKKEKALNVVKIEIDPMEIAIHREQYKGLRMAEDIIRKHLPENDGWMPVEEGLPECEKEVWIMTEKGIQTSAMYEDGTMLDKKSAWNWTDIDGEWDDEEDCMIIPEGWWEYRHFNPNDVYNCPVDEKVVAWKPLPEPYRPQKGEYNV